MSLPIIQTIQNNINNLKIVKNDIKNAVNTDYNFITNEQIESYPDLIKQSIAYYKNKVPHAIKEGTNLNFNAAPLKFDNMTIKGNAEQEQLSGKNLYGISDYEGTFKSVEVKIKDGEIMLNGTADSNGTLYIEPKNTQILNGTYMITNIFISGTQTGGGNINLRNAGDNTIIDGTQLSFGDSVRKITLNNKNIKYGIYLASGATFNSFKIKPQIVTGDVPDYDYEPYCGGQASPNPDYPQNIEVVTGDNVIKHIGKNLWDSCNIYCYNNSTITEKGVIKNDNQNYKVYKIKGLKIGIQYTISELNPLFFSTGTATRAVALTSDDSFIERLYYTNRIEAERYEHTFTVPENTDYILVQLRNTDEEMQLEEGIATPYEPCKEEEYKLELWKENEFDKNNVNKLNAYIDSSNRIIFSGATRTLYIECKKNTLYKISKAKSARFRVIYTADVPSINIVGSGYIVNDSGENITIKTGSNAKYLCVFYYHANQDTLTEQEILESMQIQETIELCKINNYKDVLFKNIVGDENYNAELDDGVWYKKKTIDKKVLDELWTWFMNSVNRFSVEIVSPNGDYVLVALCDKFINALTWTEHTNTDKSFIVRNGNWGQNKCRISFLDSDYASLAEWTQFVSENNLIVYHRLLNPTYEKIIDQTLVSQLEALSKAKGNDGTTIITTNGEGLDPVLNFIAYLKEV